MADMRYKLRLICPSGITGIAFMIRFFTAASVAAALLSNTTSAQSDHSRDSVSRHWSLGAWIAGGEHEPLKTRFGHVHDRSMLITGIDASRTLYASSVAAIRYTPTFLPFIVGTANREYAAFASCGSVALCLVGPNGNGYLLPYKKTAYAVGVLPINFDTELAPEQRVGLQIGLGGGVSLWDRRIPDPRETRFNFLADVHVGVHVLSPVGAVTAGLRLQHLSNANLGPVNPGMDSHLIYVGLQR